MSEICYYQKLCSAHSFVLEMRALLSEDIKRLEQPDRRWTRKQGQETHLHHTLRLNFGLFPPAIRTQLPETKCTSSEYGRGKIYRFLAEFHLLFIINASLPTALALVILSIHRIFFVGMAHHRGSLNHLLHEVIVLYTGFQED